MDRTFNLSVRCLSVRWGVIFIFREKMFLKDLFKNPSYRILRDMLSQPKLNQPGLQNFFLSGIKSFSRSFCPTKRGIVYIKKCYKRADMKFFLYYIFSAQGTYKLILLCLILYYA